MQLQWSRINDTLQVALLREFPEESILAEEREGILAGFLNSLRWSVLRFAMEQDPDVDELGDRVRPAITVLQTDSSFSTERMPREEMVARVMGTSGVDERIADFALKTIEGLVGRELHESKLELQVENIGTISAKEQDPQRYSIRLSNVMALSAAKLEKKNAKKKGAGQVAQA